MRRSEKKPLRLRGAVQIGMLAAMLAGGCGRSAHIAPAGDAGTPTPALPTAIPTSTPSPAPTPIPGFEGWSVINPQDVEIEADKGTITMTLLHKALWFMEQRGVLLYQPISGNFKITADVVASKNSARDEAPGGDGSVQLGGIMVRSDANRQENYVFIVVGDDGDGLSVETKNTVDGVSKFDGPAWDTPEVELEICRFNDTVSAFRRHARTNEHWIEAASYNRPDLPIALQVGLNIYTDSAPDLRVRYSNVQIENITGEAECGR